MQFTQGLRQDRDIGRLSRTSLTHHHHSVPNQLGFVHLGIQTGNIADKGVAGGYAGVRVRVCLRFRADVGGPRAGWEVCGA